MIQLFIVTFVYKWISVAKQRPHDLVYSCARSIPSNIRSLICGTLFLHAVIFCMLPMLAQAAIRSLLMYRGFCYIPSVSVEISKSMHVWEDVCCLASFQAEYRKSFYTSSTAVLGSCRLTLSQKKQSTRYIKTRCHKRRNSVPVIADLPYTM